MKPLLAILVVTLAVSTAAAQVPPGTVTVTGTLRGNGVAVDAEPPARLPQLTLEQLAPDQRALADAILKVSSVGLGGPYNSMLRSPEMGARMFSLLDYLRFNTSVPRRLNEFAILIQARLWTSQVEWLAHYPLAIAAGLPASTAADLKAGRRPAIMQADEAAVYDLCMEASTTHVVSDAVYQRAATILSERQIADLMTLSGTYATLAMVMTTFNQGVPSGAAPPLQPLVPAQTPSQPEAGRPGQTRPPRPAAPRLAAPTQAPGQTSSPAQSPTP